MSKLYLPIPHNPHYIAAGSSVYYAEDADRAIAERDARIKELETAVALRDARIDSLTARNKRYANRLNQLYEALDSETVFQALNAIIDKDATVANLTSECEALRCDVNTAQRSLETQTLRVDMWTSKKALRKAWKRMVRHAR